MPISSPSRGAAKSGFAPVIPGSTAATSPKSTPPAGDIVAVVGVAWPSDRAGALQRSIGDPLRILTRGDEPPELGETLARRGWRRRSAIARRCAIDATAYRLVHGEADRLPSLIVDRYGDYLVVQALSQGDRSAACPRSPRRWSSWLKPAGILARNDPRVRLLEGLEQRVEVAARDRARTDRGPRRGRALRVDPWRGQKTGLFLDQRENREAAARYARGRLLDAFSYNGGFALALAPQCESVLAVDISEDAVARIRANAARNGLANVEARAMNVFDELRELERRGERFDTIVLDPPAFAKNKASVPKALSGYKEINLRALKLLAAGRLPGTCSCSYNVSEGDVSSTSSRPPRSTPAPSGARREAGAGRDHRS